MIFWFRAVIVFSHSKLFYLVGASFLVSDQISYIYGLRINHLSSGRQVGGYGCAAITGFAKRDSSALLVQTIPMLNSMVPLNTLPE